MFNSHINWAITANFFGPLGVYSREDNLHVLKIRYSENFCIIFHISAPRSAQKIFKGVCYLSFLDKFEFFLSESIEDQIEKNQGIKLSLSNYSG